MSLNFFNRYPARFDAVSTEYPQGKFRNLSAPNVQDGSYLEQDWLNDHNGFFGALLRKAGMTPNGQVDTALNSQYYDALVKALNVPELTNTIDNSEDKAATPKMVNTVNRIAVNAQTAANLANDKANAAQLRADSAYDLSQTALNTRIGFNQTYQSVTRINNSNVTNNTGRPITFIVKTVSLINLTVYVNDVAVAATRAEPISGKEWVGHIDNSITVIVPNGAYYKAFWSGQSQPYFVELR